MKVKQLIKKLQLLDQDTEVILSSDAEGNSYQFLNSVNIIGYEIQDREIVVGLLELTKEDENEGYTKEDVLTNGKLGVFLYPK